jgi:hypothetical protein
MPSVLVPNVHLIPAHIKLSTIIMSFDHNTASDNELVAFCRTSSHLSLPEYPHVIQLSDTAVVKFGIGVYEEEATNQRIAFHLLNPHIVRIPEVYRFIYHQTENGVREGYLVTEYIHGTNPRPECYPELAAKLLPILMQFETIQNSVPGPLGGGPARGMFWEDDYPQFTSTKTLEDWINQRLSGDGTTVSFERTPLRLCHMDLAPRNILDLPDGSICLLDWAGAGFYPHVFEIAMLHLQPLYKKENKFIEPLLQRDICKRERTQLALVMKAWGNSQRFHM